MVKGKILLPLVALLTLMLTACVEEPTHINVEPEQLYGCWLKDGTQEYWRYNADSTGLTWDEAEDVHEGEPGSRYFTWQVSVDRLTHVIEGDEIGVPITRIYIIEAIDATTMRREEEIGTYTFTKVDR